MFLNIKKYFSNYILLSIFLLLNVYCDEPFVEINTTIVENNLHISLNHNLSPNLEAIIKISRLYQEKIDPTKYALDFYFGEGKLSEWSKPREINISREVWEYAFKKKQIELSRYGLGFEVASVDKLIEIEVLILSNYNKKKHKYDSLIYKNSKKIENKIKTENITKTVIPALDAFSLNPNITYILSAKQTPLMPALQYNGKANYFSNVMYIPMSGKFTIIEINNTYHSQPWYKVNAYDKNDNKIGVGWINSIALVGQNLIFE